MRGIYWFLAALVLGAAHLTSAAQAATVVFYSASDGSYGWYAGGSLSGARSEARGYCEQAGGADCREVATCDDGWGAVALPDAPYTGIGIACGLGNSWAARAYALAQCSVAANTLCWTDVTFNRNGSTASHSEDKDFDITWYGQGLLQIRNYEPGTSDGEMGPRTRDAVKKFQADIGLPQTGRFDDELFNRLLDSVGGVGHFVDIIDRDVVKDDKWADVTGYANAAKPAPQLNMGAELMALPAERRLAALATMLTTSGSKCAIPAKDAQLIDDDKSSAVWSIDCAEGSYTMILSADGTRMTMSGGATMKKEDEGGQSTTTVPPKGGDAAAQGGSATQDGGAPAGGAADSGGRDRSGNAGGENKH